MSRNQNVVVCIMPEQTFDLISETLTLDASSKAFDRCLRQEIGEAQCSMASGMTILPNIAIPMEVLPNTLLPDVFTSVYMGLLAGIVTKNGLEWKPDAFESVKREAIDTLRQHFGLEVPKTGKEMLLFQLSFVKTGEELRNKGFVRQHPLAECWDAPSGIWEWGNEDGIKVLTAEFDGGFFYLGEKSQELIREIVDDHRLDRLIREGEIVFPVGNDEDGILGYVWKKSTEGTSQVMRDNRHLHVYQLLDDQGHYRIVSGTHTPEACREMGYILTRNRVDIGGAKGILIRMDSSYPLQNKIITRK